MPATLDHATIVASDLERSARFYDAALGALGVGRLVEFGDEEEDDPPIEAVAWGEPAPDGPDRVLLWVVVGDSDHPATRNVHLRLRADSRSAVEAFHRAAVEAGGSSCAGPRRWAIYRPGEFTAVVADPDGNRVEAVSQET